MLLAALSSVLLAQLTAAEITIDLSTDSAVIEARYEMLEPIDSIDLTLIRVRGQGLQLLTGRPAISLAAPGLYRLTSTHALGPQRYVEVRYNVVGDLDRVPIAVPDVSPPAEGARVRVRVSGLSRAAALDDAFPRLTPQADGTATAELESVPSFLRTPPDGHVWSINHLADASVGLLVLAATALWLSRRRWAARVADTRVGSVR